MSSRNPHTLVHATSVLLGKTVRRFGGDEDSAVILLGPPGAGKSDVALRLIGEGGTLIADDQTRISSNGVLLFAEAVENTAGLIEVRGVGIIRLDHAAQAPIALAVNLEPGAAPERLPKPALYAPPAPLAASRPPPLVNLNPFEASVTAKIAVAAAAAVSGRFVSGVAP